MKKRVTVTHFTVKIIRTYLYINCNKKILFVKKNILVYCGYSPTCPFFLLLSEHKHCDNAAANWNSENARSRIGGKFVGKCGYGDRGR
jgi:hypothetical protein